MKDLFLIPTFKFFCFYLTCSLLFYSCLPLVEVDDKGEEPTADFSVDQNNILPLTTVQFTDLSTGGVTGWWWQFGDGGTSILQHPQHQYNELGTFDVSLMVSNSNGSNEVLKRAFIEVGVDIGPEGTVTDVDGNSYKTVKIGPQWWMAENVRTTRYSNGSNIPLITENEDWINLGENERAMMYFAFETSNQLPYGALYTWTAASNGQSGEKVQGICPEGWHLPSDEEWAELEINLGMKHTITDDYGYRGTDQGSRMAGHASLWKWGELVNDPSFGYSGLNILPSGAQIGGGSLYLGEEAFYWTSTIYGSGDKVWDRRFLYDFAGVYRDFSPKTNGMCVRCVKD